MYYSYFTTTPPILGTSIPKHISIARTQSTHQVSRTHRLLDQGFDMIRNRYDNSFLRQSAELVFDRSEVSFGRVSNFLVRPATPLYTSQHLSAFSICSLVLSIPQGDHARKLRARS
jgi:hypothetical protein